MGMKTYTVDGYGVCTSDLNFKKDAELVSILKNMMKNTDFEKDYSEYFLNVSDKDFLSNITDVSEYECCYGANISWFITNIMNEKEKVNLSVLSPDEYNNSYITVNLYYPFEQIPPEYIHTKEEYNAILRKYLNMVTDDEIHCDYFTAEYYG